MTPDFLVLPIVVNRAYTPAPCMFCFSELVASDQEGEVNSEAKQAPCDGL